MGMSAREWDSLVREAQRIAGDEWTVVGRNRKAYLMRLPVGWWVQFIYYENTSAGRLVAYQEILSRPLTSYQLGVGGIVDYRIPEFRAREVTPDNPELISEFAETVTGIVYRPMWDVKAELARSENQYRKNCDAGRKERIYRGVTRQDLVAQRILCRSRALPDLRADVQWVLDDPEVGERIRGDRSADFGEQATIDYWRAVAARLEAADSDGLNELLLAQRRKSLLGLGLSEDLIGTPDFPEPEVAW